jgi:hypothetical protein
MEHGSIDNPDRTTSWWPADVSIIEREYGNELFLVRS